MPTIVIADDHAFCRELLAAALESAGFQVLAAPNGQDVLDLLRSHKTDLVVLDVQMPILDGIATVRAIRAHPDFKPIPVFLLTGRDDRESIRAAAHIGVQGYILKSQFNLPEFLERIAKYVPATAGATVPARQ